MQIDGYRQHGDRDETDAFHLLLAVDVIEFLRGEANGGNRKHVTKVGHTLELIKRNGLGGIRDSTLFVHEGKFPGGRPGIGELAVYAVKSFQVRVYGGLIRWKNERVFLCPEGVIKKRDRADQEQLKRVAKILGMYHGK